jgi:methenyltetrahydromethanopterin cyclohydrolase
LILLVARTASIAGTYQVVARSVEACLHKLHELGFDVMTIRSGIGSAFLPPVPKDDLTAIGRTNDSILYGGEVMLWVDAEDDEIQKVGAKLPSSASPDYGEPFVEIFKRYGGDFYKIDPMLFSPARVAINNLKTGSYFSFGKVDGPLVARSFFSHNK